MGGPYPFPVYMLREDFDSDQITHYESIFSLGDGWRFAQLVEDNNGVFAWYEKEGEEPLVFWIVESDVI